MGNTEFFRETANLNSNFKWGEIFSNVTEKHTNIERDKLWGSGCELYMPSEGKMLKEWTKPWLFARFGVIGLFFVLLMGFMQNIALASSLVALQIVVPAFVMPITVLIFFWEMNVPRNVSFAELVKIVMFAGLLSCMLTFVLRDIFLMDDNTAAYIAGPIPEEIAKFVMVYFIIKKKNYKYTLNGLLVGCAVGVGFAAQESAGYAVNMLFATGSMDALKYINVLRGVLSIGGHAVWASLYGAALASVKKDKPLSAHHIVDAKVLIYFFSAILLHVVWNFPIENLLVRFADIPVTYGIYAALEKYYGKYILLIVIAWALNFKLLREGLVEVIAVGNRAAAASPAVNPGMSPMAGPAAGAAYGQGAVPAFAASPSVVVTCANGVLQGRSFSLNAAAGMLFGRDGASAVRFPDGTKGISGRHCEIKIKEGVPVIIDRGSTYGTFFEDGTKLEVNRPYRLQNGMSFYLATKENKFTVRM